MKKINFLFALLVLAVFSLKAQTAFNPFTQNIHFAPEPTVSGFECGSTPSVVFTQGLTTSADATLWQTEPLAVTVCLSGFTFNGPASSIVSGPYATNFTWAFDPFNPNCIIGTQNQILQGTGSNPIFPNPLSSGDVILALKVPDSSPVGTILAVNVTLQVPSYMSTFNSLPDDNESTQTQTFCGCYALTDPGTIAGDQSFCASGDPIAFTSVTPGSGGSGSTIVYQWQVFNAPNWDDIAGATSEIYDPSTTSVNQIFRRNAKRSLCGTWLSSDSIYIVINNAPTANAGPDKNLNCTTLSATIGTSSITGNTYSWLPATGLNSTSIAQPTANPTSTTVYTVTVTNVNNCTSVDEVVVNVDTTLPTANAGNDDTLNCLHTSSTIGSVAVTGNTYFWIPALGLSSASSAQPIATPTSTSTYTLTVTGANGCVASDEVTISVNTTLPVADAGIAKNICVEDSVQIGTPEIIGNSYSWLPTIGLSASNVAQPMASPAATTVYTVTVTSLNGCTSTSTVTVTVVVCQVSISGNVFNDTTALLNFKVDGPAISNPDTVQLYVSLVNSNGIVIAVTPVDTNGYYQFTNVSTNQTYTVVLSTNAGVVGMPPPIIELPGTWVNTGEDCCDQSGDDGNPDGVTTVVVTTTNIDHIDFGIKDPVPTGFPVVLKNFFVTEYNCDALLSWTTSQEINTSHVDIYRKDNSQSNFKKLATVLSAGESQTEKVYSYLDKTAEENIGYEYQLKFVDIDKQFTLSDIKTLNLNCSDETTSLNIFPNPVTSELNILFVTDQVGIELQLEVVDIVGRTIISKSSKIDHASTVITLDMSSFATGNYILRYRDTDAVNEGSLKFTKN